MFMALMVSQFLTVCVGSFGLAYYFLHIENILAGRGGEDYLFLLFLNLYTSISVALLSFLFAFPCTAMFFVISESLIRRRVKSLLQWVLVGVALGAVAPLVFLLWPLAIVFGSFGGVIGLLMWRHALKVYASDQTEFFEKGVSP